MAQEVARVARRLEEAKETKHLDLSQCQLMKIPEAAYLMLKNSMIHKCDLSGNMIKNISSKFCTKFPALIELQIQENQLSALPAEIRQMEELRILDISGNKFESLPTSLYDCPKLSTINAKDNKIKDVDIERLNKMSSLQELDLQDNKLSEEVKEKLQDIDMFTVLLGESDPLGKQLDDLE